MNNLLTKKKVKKWTQYCLANFPLAMKHLAICLGQKQEEVLKYAFDNSSDAECQKLIKKFFFYQKVLDLQDSDFLHPNLKERFEKIFPAAQERYSKLEETVTASKLEIQEKVAMAEPLKVSVPTEEAEFTFSVYQKPVFSIPPFRDKNHDITRLKFKDEKDLTKGRSFSNFMRLAS